MNRLTIRNSDGSASQPTNTTIESVFEKLAEYEDAEEQGRLKKLPCKVGDTVYWLTPENEIINLCVTKFIIYGLSSDPRFEAEYTWCGIKYSNYFNFGKTVFLTREEAEAEKKARSL